MQIPDPLILIAGGLVYFLMILSIGGLLVIGTMAFDAPDARKKLSPKLVFGGIMIIPVLGIIGLLALIIALISGNTSLAVNIATLPFVVYGTILIIGMPLVLIGGIITGIMQKAPDETDDAT